MTVISPEALLSGWRGRRLLLELALASERLLAERAGAEQPLAMAVMSAAYDLDPGKGRSVALFGSGTHEERPAADPGTVASLLDAVHLADVGAVAALRALADVVDAARYWQEPDGEDVLAATPAVRAALGRIAVRVAGSATGVGWWTEPVARADQHAVTWDAASAPGGDGTGGGATGAAERLALWRADVLDEERHARRRPADPGAPWSGGWWSSPPSQLTRTTRSLGRIGPAGLWLVEDGMGWERAVTRRVEVPAAARVLEIDTADTWAELCREHPLEVTAQKRHDWYRTTGRAGRWVTPDWVRLAAAHDAVHLTAAAYVSAAGTAIPVDHDTASVIAGWNPDETFWFTDAVRPEQDGTAWTLDDDGEWAPTT